jgi:hypothetical protein
MKDIRMRRGLKATDTMNMGAGCGSVAAASTTRVDSARAARAMNTIRSRSRIYSIWVPVERGILVEAVLVNISIVRQKLILFI